MEKLNKILFLFLILIMIISIVYAFSLSTTTKQERVERMFTPVYLENHKYLVYEGSKTTCIVHSEECEKCKNK